VLTDWGRILVRFLYEPLQCLLVLRIRIQISTHSWLLLDRVCRTTCLHLLNTFLGPPSVAETHLLQVAIYICSLAVDRCTQGSHVSLKVLENRTGAWKLLNFIPQVLESPWIHQVKLHDVSNFVKPVFCLKQDLLIIVMFCFYRTACNADAV